MTAAVLAEPAVPEPDELTASRATSDAGRVARRQLRSVLVLLALLDLAILLFVLLLVLERDRWGLTNLELFLGILTGAVAVIGTRILLAIRLRAGGGNLF